MEYYSALNGNEIQTQTTTCMNLKDVMLRETIQSHKDKCYIITSIWCT